MDLIKKDKLNQEIKGTFDYSFQVSDERLYFIEIIASAKSWWQNLSSFKSFFNDDDLAVKIDGKDFPKLNGKRGLFDGEAAWNGNNLKGLSKVCILLVNLGKGSHTLNFLADQNPILESIALFKVDAGEINYTIGANATAQDGDRRQWITFALADLQLKQIYVKASTKYSKGKDDDDIKLIIDGTIQKNKENKAHENWYWCGRTLKGNSKEFDKNVNLEKGMHYVELWADKTPFIDKIKLSIEKTEPTKRIPSVDDPKWTGDFADDSDEMILARLIFGEAENQPDEGKEWVGWSVINRMEAKSWWPDTVHAVILQKGQFDPFKPSDSNFRKISDPFGFKDNIPEATKKSWFKCYEIAKAIVTRKTDNPTKATHFYGGENGKEWFEKHIVPNGKFLKKIGDTYFYWSPN